MPTVSNAPLEKAVKPGSIPLAGYRRALRFITPYWPRLVFVMLTGIVATSFGLIQPYLSKLLIDDALLKRNMRALLLVSGLTVGATILSFVLNILSSYQYVKISAVALFEMRLALYRHLQTLSPRFWASRKLGDVISRINNDIAEVQRVCSDTLLSIFSNIVFLGGSILIMTSLNLQIFLLSAAVVPISIWALRYYQKRLTERVKEVRERSADIGSFLLETLLGIRLVVTSHAQQREVDRFRDRNNKFIDALLRMQVVSMLSGAMPGAVLTLATAALFLYGGKLVIDGKLTTGSLIALMSYHARLLAPIQSMMGLYTNVVTGGVSLGRVFELFDTHAEVTERPGAVAPAQIRGAIELDQVTFRYAANPVLDGLSFRVEPGTICALLGPSGVGKSTVADLLVRFYDPNGGAVKLDGHDLRDLPLETVRKSIVLLDQTPYLLHASVRENVAYGRPEASFEEIVEVCKAAAIHDRILALPEGYETNMAERGQTLSVGERQRVALARALLTRPAVLVLDEPTSALDEANERAIGETLATALRGCTAILITHRASLARIADQTIILSPVTTGVRA